MIKQSCPKTSVKPCLKWRRTVAEDGAIDFHAKLKRPYDLHFSVWINALEPGDRTRLVDLSAWIGQEEEPTYSQVVRLPLSQTLDEALTRVPGWQDQLVRDTAATLRHQAYYILSLLS